MFGHLLLKLRGGGDRQTCNMEGGEWAGTCPWWGRGGVAPPPRNWKKKMLSEEILTSFTYVLLMKLGWNRYTIHAKWKGGLTGACP